MKYLCLFLILTVLSCKKTQETTHLAQPVCWHCVVTPYRGGRTIVKDTCLRDSATLGFEDTAGHKLVFICVMKK